MSFGKTLIQLRESKGLSQYEVAEKLGIKRARYNSWENEIAKPRHDMLHKLAEFYNVSPDYLLGYEKEKEAVPSWATTKDKRDLKKMLEDPDVLYYDGIEFPPEDRAKMIGIVEAVFWEAKQMNKEAYKNRKKKKTD